MYKDEFYIKVRGVFIVWFIVIIHIIFVFNLCQMVSTITRKEVTKDNTVVQENDVNLIYSDCKHNWQVINQSNNDCYITVKCDECGTLQVINTRKPALYVNSSNPVIE